MQSPVKLRTVPIEVLLRSLRLLFTRSVMLASE
jgi:hypothetical protein